MSPRYAAVAAFLLSLNLSLFAQQRPPDPFEGPSLQDTGSEQSRAPGSADRPRLQTANLSGVVLDRGRHPIDGARIELRSPQTGLTLTTTYTRGDGSFEITGLQGQGYEIVITSGTTESRERIDLFPGDSTVTITMPVLTADYSGTPTVSIADLKVPDKARNEVEKAEHNLSRKPEDARKELMKALEVYPKYGKAHMLLGLLNMQQNRIQEATSELETSVQCDPGNAMAFTALAAAYTTQKRYPDAVRALDSGTRLAPASWQTHFEMARAKLGLKDYPAALESASKAEQLCSSGFAPIHLLKANALIGVRDYPKASVELEEYLRSSPQGPEATEARQTLGRIQAFNTARR